MWLANRIFVSIYYYKPEGMVRHPHSVTVSWKGTPTRNETTGSYTAGSDVSFTADCSIMQNSKGQKVADNDGKMIEYSFAVMMDKQTSLAPYGSEAIVVFGNAGGSTKETVKRMHNFQTYSKIWL